MSMTDVPGCKGVISLTEPEFFFFFTSKVGIISFSDGVEELEKT